MKKKLVFIISISLCLTLLCGCQKKITEIFLQTEEISLKLGESHTLTYTYFPTDADPKNITYTSINPEIATVSENGVIQSVSVGETNIVVSTKSDVSASCKVIVQEPSAIDQLNDAEAKLYDYLTSTMLNDFYNAPKARLRNIWYYIHKEGTNPDLSSLYLEIQGTNRLGGTLSRQYTVMLSGTNSFHLPLVSDADCADDEFLVSADSNFIDYKKINLALEEYWKSSGM